MGYLEKLLILFRSLLNVGRVSGLSRDGSLQMSYYLFHPRYTLAPYADLAKQQVRGNADKGKRQDDDYPGHPRGGLPMGPQQDPAANPCDQKNVQACNDACLGHSRV